MGTKKTPRERQPLRPAAGPEKERRPPVARARATPRSSRRANKMAADGKSGVRRGGGLPEVRWRLGRGATSGGGGQGEGQAAELGPVPSPDSFSLQVRRAPGGPSPPAGSSVVSGDLLAKEAEYK